MVLILLFLQPNNDQPLHTPPSCGHLVCRLCVDDWNHSRAACPTCNVHQQKASDTSGMINVSKVKIIGSVKEVLWNVAVVKMIIVSLISFSSMVFWPLYASENTNKLWLTWSGYQLYFHPALRVRNIYSGTYTEVCQNLWKTGFYWL